MMDYVTTSEAADFLGVSIRRVQAMIRAGRLPAQQIGGRVLLIARADLKLVADRKPGRPPNTDKAKPAAPKKRRPAKRKETK